MRGSVKAPYLVFDLETSGLSNEKNGVVEVAMIMVDPITLEERGRYEAIIAPYPLLKYNDEGKKEFVDYEISEYAMEVNGISMKKLQSGVPAKKVCLDMIAFSKENGSRGSKAIPVGHNINNFDLPFLAYFFECNGKDLSSIMNPSYSIDTMLESWRMFPEESGTGAHTLDTLCGRLGVEKFNAHSAMPDTVANYKAFKVMQEKLRGQALFTETIVEKKRVREYFKF